VSITYINRVEQSLQKAQKAREKAVKKERKTAQVFSNAQHKHDLAVADEKKAENDLSVCIVVLPAAQTTLITPNYVFFYIVSLFVSHCAGSCVRGTFNKPIKLLNTDVLSLSKLGARRILGM
jgi:hypothetical protein